jgi:hypothetical protein
MIQISKNDIYKIKTLQDEVRKATESSENKRRKTYWETSIPIGVDALARMVPVKNKLSFTVDLDRCGYSKLLDFSLVKFLTNPVSYVKNSLKISLLRFNKFKDCMPIGKSTTYFSGSGFKNSLYGGEQIITEEDAWVARKETFMKRIPISELPEIDFYNNPVMKYVHKFCDNIKELVDDDFDVEFPVWNRSAWGLAWHLRGIDNLIIDYLDDPEWLTNFLDYLNRARFKFETERCSHFGKKLLPGSLYNDEVTVPIVSPNMYTNLILPSEIQTAKFYGILNYWHSCGNTTLLMDKINTIPNLRMVHVSGWSNFHTAACTYSKDIALQFALQPIADVLSPTSSQHVDNRLYEITENAKGRPATVMLDAIQMLSSVKDSMDSIYHWIDRANEILIA